MFRKIKQIATKHILFWQQVEHEEWDQVGCYVKSNILRWFLNMYLFIYLTN